MKTPSAYEKAASRSLNVLHWILFALNVVLLLGLGFRTAQAWFSVPFEFRETMRLYPSEPEFADVKSAERQMKGALIFATAVYVIGAFFCYELFIKTKSLLTNLAAPLFIGFLLLTGESAHFFLPATDKARAVKTCEKAGIVWDKKAHFCDVMQLERKRLAKIRAQKKKATRRTARRTRK